MCFSHLRWDFVFQRPQHLLTRFYRNFRIFYVEEPWFHNGQDEIVETIYDNIHVITPRLTGGPEQADVEQRQRVLIQKLTTDHEINDFILWYYTPMALPLTRELKPSLVIYDCMDELSAFRFAPASLKLLERELMSTADIVFTGGHSLYEAKKHQHHNIHAFPSSIDKKHFSSARTNNHEPEDQKQIGHPRLGFYGVIDERFDLELIRESAAKRPDWNFIIIGPVVKIDPATLPRANNIHYLGSKKYAELPSYLSGWDVALVSFALNESTTFISPTKTPEYLAAGKPVISTAIRDVVNSYGNTGLVHIVNNADELVKAAEKEIGKDKKRWLQRVDKLLAQQSWDITVSNMRKLIIAALLKKNTPAKEYADPTFAAHYLMPKQGLTAAS